VLGCGIFSTGGEVPPKRKGADMPTMEELLNDLGTVIPLPPEGGSHLPSLYEFIGGSWENYAHGIPDVYDLLNEYGGTHIARKFPEAQPEAFVLLTTGYAAPLNDDGEVGDVAPSQHPKRRRVSLFVVSMADGEQCSRLIFHDTDETVTEADSYSGSLAECIDMASAYVWGARFLRGLSERALQEEDSIYDEARLRARLGRLIRVRQYFDDDSALRFEEN
jgi:hypothetical protein